jgi:hypothetical protein
MQLVPKNLIFSNQPQSGIWQIGGAKIVEYNKINPNNKIVLPYLIQP